MRETSRRRALIVEWDRWKRDSMSQLLVEAGYDVVCASNGFTGLRLAESEHPNLIVLGSALAELGTAPLLEALQANRSTRGVPVLLVDRRGGGVKPGDRLLRSRLPRRSGGKRLTPGTHRYRGAQAWGRHYSMASSAHR